MKPNLAEAVTTKPVWIFGARGMLAGEFLRMLETHPAFELRGASSREPSSLAAAHPHLSSDTRTTSITEAEDELVDHLGAGHEAVLILALPHGESAPAWMRLAQKLGQSASGLLVVDLSADFRLRDPELYRAAYGREHPVPDELPNFVYGLPELDREWIASSRRVAAPGCFATALQLATLPAARAGLVDTTKPWVLNAVTGSSGSGRSPKPGTHHPHRNGNLWAYSLGGHRHEAELVQSLERFGIEAPLHFLPHSGPFARGIHLTAVLPTNGALDADEVRRAYAESYAGEPFVEVLADGVPDLRTVVGSNRASLAVHTRGEMLTVLLTLDNLIKGGAGQALQCLNLMAGCPETWGLARSGMGTC